METEPEGRVGLAGVVVHRPQLDKEVAEQPCGESPVDTNSVRLAESARMQEGQDAFVGP